MQNLFTGIEKASKRFESNWEKPGKYIERIEKISVIQDRNRKTKIIINKTVIKVLDSAEGKGHIAGEEIGHMIDTHNDAFLPTVKTIICNIMGATPDEVTNEVCNAWCGVDPPGNNPWAGWFVLCENIQRPTKQGGVFTNINYRKRITVSELRQPEILSAQDIERFGIPEKD